MVHVPLMFMSPFAAVGCPEVSSWTVCPFQAIIQQQQAQLLQQLQESQRQQQELQRRLQEQLNGVTQQPFAQSQVPQFPAQFEVREAIKFPPGRQFPVEPPPPPCSTASGEAGLCRPLVRCITFYAEVPELRRQPCRLQGRELGVCCPLKKRPSSEYTALLALLALLATLILQDMEESSRGLFEVLPPYAYGGTRRHNQISRCPSWEQNPVEVSCCETRRFCLVGRRSSYRRALKLHRLVQ
jgi:hypothetical protein